MSSQTHLGELKQIFRELNQDLSKLRFTEPVTHVYNPLLYAKEASTLYAERFLLGPPGRTLLLGMNPGPWGMAQTGVPFGEIAAVRDWLGIESKVEKPKNEHPKRPVTGFDCPRSEVSGRRLWGLFREKFGKPEEFSKHYLVFNYCPLIFLEESGRNRTPDKLPKSEREALFAACDQSLLRVLKVLEIERAFGVGKFALKCLQRIQKERPELRETDSILHPSPANPAANRGWAEAVWPKLKPKKRRV